MSDPASHSLLPPNTSPQLAPIELLPVEITQNIFLQTLNLNFPLSSPIIASKLSDKHVYRFVCDHAFGYDVLPTIPKPKHLPTYQNQLFAIRWMRWDFFEEYISQRVPPRACGCPILIDCHDTSGRPAIASCNCIIPDCKLRRHGEDKSTNLPRIRCSLPQKLVHGPWTTEKIRFLNGLLRISNMSVDWADKSAVRAAVQGKREAIMDGNLDAVHIFSRTRRLGRAPNLELVKFAVLEAGCNRSIVLNLMTAAREWGHRKWNDVELDTWVAQQEGKGGPKGEWLKIKLEELRSGRYPDVQSGDYVGGDVLEIRDAPFRVRSLPNAFDSEDALITIYRHSRPEVSTC
jgi:hypothetical protein